jgi:hypothetical protein
MAKNKLEEKVEKLASSEVDTFIRRNENKQTTGRNVRPVIESWVDELENIASSTDRDEASPEDFQRIRKAANTLRNILKVKDDELTYFMVNAPKKFWDTLRYIFDDTFTQRTYDPQPLTKYEIPGYAPQRMGLKPSLGKEKPGSNIPDKPKMNLSRVPKNPEPSFDLDKHRQGRTNHVVNKEELEVTDPGILSRIRKQHDADAEEVQEEVPVEIELSKREDTGMSQDDFIEIWHRIAICAQHIFVEEQSILNDLDDSSIQDMLPKIASYAQSIIDKVSTSDLIDSNSLKEAIRTPFESLKKSKNVMENLVPSGARTVFTQDMDQAITEIMRAYNNIIEFNFDGIDKRNLNSKIVPLLDNASTLVDSSKNLVKADLVQKQLFAARVEKIESIKKQYEVAANTGNDNGVRDKISDLFHNPKSKLIPEKMSDDNIIKYIMGYLKVTIKSAAYRRTRLLVNAIKRLNGYVR